MRLRTCGDRQMFDGAGRGLADSRCDLGAAAFREDQAGRARALSGAADRPEILRVLDLVEGDEQRPSPREQPIGVGVAEVLDVRTHPLMALRPTAREDRLDCCRS